MSERNHQPENRETIESPKQEETTPIVTVDAFFSGLKANTAEDIRAQLIERGASESFADRASIDTNFLEKCAKASARFESTGEGFVNLQEIEAYTDLYPDTDPDPSSLLKSISIEKNFGMKDLKGSNLAAFRLMLSLSDIKAATKDIQVDIETLARQKVAALLPPDKAQLLQRYAENGDGGGWSKEFFETTSSNPELLKAMLVSPEVIQVYNEYYDAPIETIGKRLRFYSGESATGTIEPKFEIQSTAINEQTGSVSTFSGTIEKSDAQSPDGETSVKRKISDVTIQVDSAARGSGSGMQFLLSQIPQQKNLAVDEMTFLADINMGSYVWRKVADVDVMKQANEVFSEEDWRALKREGKTSEKDVRQKLFESYLWPKASDRIQQYAEDLRANNALSPAQLEQLSKDWKALQAKVDDGTITIADLGDFGKGMNVCGFNNEGHVIPSNDSRVVKKGHIGQAVLIDFPWQAKISLKKKDLFKHVDALLDGKPLKKALAKTGIALFV